MRSPTPFAPETLGPPWDGPGQVAGVDEAGRGPLAGPVVACAVILDPMRPIDGLADSKALSPARRQALSLLILERAAACGIGSASAAEIDRLDILRATGLAMQRAVAALLPAPDRVLVDGDRVPPLPHPAVAVVRGDARVAAISAASIVAKVHRDRWCLDLHERFPGYGFDVHKGYPTPGHLEALARLGPCDEHRTSFGPVRAWLAMPRPAPTGEPGRR